MAAVRLNQAQTDLPVCIDELCARCVGNLELVERVLQTFQDRFAESLEQLDSALQSEDYAEMARIAHQMKGSTRTVAAHDLARCTELIEEAAGAGLGDRAGQHIEQLKAEWTRFDDLNELLFAATDPVAASHEDLPDE